MDSQKMEFIVNRSLLAFIDKYGVPTNQRS